LKLLLSFSSMRYLPNPKGVFLCHPSSFLSSS
jgi:hypothetical protein